MTKPRLVEDSHFVPCTKCGRSVPGGATRCHHCGIHYLGQARDFSRVSGVARGSSSRVIWIVFAIPLIIAVLVVLSTLS